MMVKRRNLWMALLLVFTLLTAGFQMPVMAAAPDTQGTVSVFGSDNVNPLLAETPVTYGEKETAAEVLVKAVGESNVEYTHYDFGDMITGIKGLKADDSHYWAFYINGVAAQAGAQSYVVQNGDHLSFRYSDFNPPKNSASINVVDDQKKTTNELSQVAIIGHPTALQLLKVAIGTDKVGLMDTKYGKMITSINGLKAEDPNYWAFYVNGKMATVGADTYQLQPGDKISFQYESWQAPTDDSDNGTANPSDNGGKTPSTTTVPESTVKKAVTSVSHFVMEHEIGDWEAIALKQAGKEIPKSYLENVKKLVKDKQGRFSKITDTERYVLGILAAGGDPTNVEGYNLVESVYNGKVTKQGLIGVAYALIALNSADFEIPKTAEWTKENLVNYLLEKQNQDGGWAWDESTKSDIDTTAMILTALAPSKDSKNVKERVDSGVTYLSKQYLGAKIDNSSTVAQVVIALSALKIDANGSLFATEKSSIFQFFLSFQNKDGGFGWKKGDNSDVFSTAQGFQALVAYQLNLHGKDSLYQLPLVAQNNKNENPKMDVPKVKDTQVKKEDTKAGHPLPNTATNTVNILALGLLFLLMAAVLYLRQQKIKN